MILMGGAWETISKPILNVREMQLKACLNMTSGMGGLGFKQTESETHTSNNWHLFTPEMGWFNIFNWILISKWFDCQGNLERTKKELFHRGQHPLSYYILYSESKTQYPSLPRQGQQNPTSQFLLGKCVWKNLKKFFFQSFWWQRDMCEWAPLWLAWLGPEQTNIHHQCTIIHWNSLVCGWILTESSSWVSHWLTFFCKEI